jgi:uncharacterized protein (TIGR00661 family)
MKMGFSINGEGRGHLMRILALADRIVELSGEQWPFSQVQPVFWCPEKYHKEIRSHFPWAEIFSIPYYRIILDGAKIDLIKTGFTNVEHFSRIGRYSTDISDQMRFSGISLLVSDFEPFSTRAAMELNIRVLQFNHPGIVLKSPSLLPDAMVAKLVALIMMGSYHERIISSFYHGDVGPIIRRELRSAPFSREDYYIVYLHGDMKEAVLRYLDRYSPLPCHVFPDPAKDFLTHLTSCSGIISNAGHQLMSEALHLEKPILSLPLEGQYEQRLNARMLEVSGRGLSGAADKPEPALERFFRFTEKESRPAASNPSNTNESKFVFKDDSLRAAGLILSGASRLSAVS